MTSVNNLLSNDFIYRTEVYVQQREKQIENQSCSIEKVTWKYLKSQKETLNKDQAEIDRVLSTIDSIHGTFNRSSLMPYNQVYSSLYGDDDSSIHLMNKFCQHQFYFKNTKIFVNENDEDSNTQDISSSFGNFFDTDDDDQDCEDEIEKQGSYDSGYESVMPIKQLSRESLLKMTRILDTK